MKYQTLKRELVKTFLDAIITTTHCSCEVASCTLVYTPDTCCLLRERCS
jgi:hypothetical protein